MGLELLRFVAALAVLIWHYQHFSFIGVSPVGWQAERLPFRWVFAPFYTYGYQGVELFWCISGFVFAWKYGALIGGAGISLWRFAWRRFSRLYPLHLVTLLIMALLQSVYASHHGDSFVYIFNDARHFLLNLAFANWWGFQSGESFNGPSWSVSAELLIYLVFFCVCRVAGPDWRAGLLMLVSLSILGWAAKAMFGMTLPFTGAGVFFYLGVLTLHCYQWTETRGIRVRSWIAGGSAIAVIVAAGLVLTHALAIAGAGLMMFPALILLVQLTVHPRTAAARARLTALGNLTYASYMLHFPMQLGIVLIFGLLAVPVQNVIYSGWFLLAYLVSVLGTALVVFHWLERPVQRWLRRIV